MTTVDFEGSVGLNGFERRMSDCERRIHNLLRDQASTAAGADETDEGRNLLLVT